MDKGMGSLGAPIQRRGLMLVVSSPSGAGKTSLTRALLKADPEVALSISATTRPPRPNEIDGTHYFFRSRRAFEDDVAAGKFLEWAEVFGHFYGTPRGQVEALLASGRDVLFDVDWQGARALGAAAPQDVVRVFILPPSIAELRARLEGRKEDPREVIERRMAAAGKEIVHWRDYDYALVNENFDRCYADLVAILAAERLKRTRQQGLGALVSTLLKDVAE